MNGHASKCFQWIIKGPYYMDLGTWSTNLTFKYRPNFLEILVIECSLQKFANEHGVLTIMSFMVDHNFLLIWLFFFFLSLRIRYAADVCILIADFVNLLLSKSPNWIQKINQLLSNSNSSLKISVMFLPLMIIICYIEGYLGIHSKSYIQVLT